MKKIFNYKISACMVAVVLMTTSCKKYINLEPEDATYDQVFWQSGANVDKALSGAYGLFRTALREERSHFIFGDFVTDQFIRGSSYWNYADLSYAGRNHYSYVPYLENAVLNWTRFYGLINQCHLVVEKTPAIPVARFNGGTEEQERFLGEGHFLRAFAYFYMTRVWGDPVLTKEALKDPLNIQPIPRSPESEVLDYCIEDLKQAASLLPLGDGTSESRVRTTKGAAWALLAHVYAWKHDYENAKKYCDSVIFDGGYSLESIDSYEEIWKGDSNESIFELFTKFNETSNEASASFYNGFLFEPVVDRGVGSAWRVNEDYVYDLFEDTLDQRPFKIFAEGQGGTMIVKYSNINYYDANRPETYVVDNNLVLFRLADIYLLRAEANFDLGNVDAALSDVNAVRERAGVEAMEEGDEFTMETILDERKRELYGEGCLAYDNIRMILTNPEYADNLPEPYTQERVQKKGYYWPLSMRMLLPQNALLTQNEWWKNH